MQHLVPVCIYQTRCRCEEIECQGIPAWAACVKCYLISGMSSSEAPQLTRSLHVGAQRASLGTRCADLFAVGTVGHVRAWRPGVVGAAPPLRAMAVDHPVRRRAISDLTGTTHRDIDRVPRKNERLVHLGVAAWIRERETVAAVAVLRPYLPRVDDRPVGLCMAEQRRASLDYQLCTRTAPGPRSSA